MILETMDAGIAIPDPLVPEPEPSTVELIRDRYAALQAWEEWTGNAADSLDVDPQPMIPDHLRPSLKSNPANLSPDNPPADLDRSGVRIEPAEAFEPYGDLFRPRNPSPQSDA